MITLLYVASTVSRTSATDQFLNVVRHLDPQEYRVCVLTLSPEPDNSRWAQFEAAGAQMQTLGLSRWRGLVSARRLLKRHIQQLRPDVIHTQGIRADGLVASLRSLQPAVPHVITVHSHLRDDYRYTYGAAMGGWMTRAQFRAFRRADVCVGVSPGVARYLQEQDPELRVVTIPNGVDTTEYRPVGAAQKRALRQALGLPGDHRVLVYSGNLSALKDPLFLIEVWPQVAAAIGPATLLLLGDGPLEAACRQKAGADSGVVLAGRVQDVARYLQASDYLVSASHSEGYPVAVIEGLACGLPVLLSDIPAHRDLIHAGPELGLCFTQGSQAAFSQAVQQLVAWNREEAADRVSGYARAQRSAAAMARAYQVIYRDLCARK